jgi:hypothetical protein
MLGGAACLLSATLAFWFGYRRCARRYDAITTVPHIATKDIPGLGAAMVDLCGRACVDKPLLSDLARMPCVAFQCGITERWTTTRTERDSEGKTRTVTEHHSETRYSNHGRVDFQLRDESGSVTIRPDGASIDMLDSLGDLHGPVADSPAYGISPRHFGGSLDYSEAVLPVGQQVYVLGQVSEEHAIQQPGDTDQPFIISYRREEDLVRSALWGKRIGAIAALALLIAGLVLLIPPGP